MTKMNVRSIGRKWRGRFRMSPFICAGIMVLSVAACSKSPQIRFSVTGQKYMNGGGYAALICIYQLKSDANFARVPLESFWREGQNAFQSDMVGSRTEVMLAPGETKEVTVILSEETRFIGAAADFRKPEGDMWRQIYEVNPKKKKFYQITKKSKKTVEIVVGMGGIELKY